MLLATVLTFPFAFFVILCLIDIILLDLKSFNRLSFTAGKFRFAAKLSTKSRVLTHLLPQDRHRLPHYQQPALCCHQGGTFPTKGEPTLTCLYHSSPEFTLGFTLGIVLYPISYGFGQMHYVSSLQYHTEWFCCPKNPLFAIYFLVPLS